MLETNETNTLEQKVQNTDETLDKEQPNGEIDSNNSDSSSTGLDVEQQESSEVLEDTKFDQLSKEQLDSMSDDEFTAFMDENKVPDRFKGEATQKVKAKVISRPEQPSSDKSTKQIDDFKARKEEKGTEVPVDYENAYKAIFKPFKANGKMITPRNIDDVVQLMQMGANYTQKLQTMQPLRKIAESVTKANINQEDLNFLIDIHNGDKEAIKQLLSKHKVDPIDLDLDTTNYVPKNNIVSDADIEYSSVLDDIKDSIPKITEIMNKTWDTKSKESLLSDPMLMKALHEEIQHGRFEKVQAQLEIEKVFGRYKGVSDLDAYRDVLSKMTQSQQVTPQDTPQVRNGSTKFVPDKTKAAPVRTKASNQGSKLSVKDLFSMSDEQFNKLSLRDLV